MSTQALMVSGEHLWKGELTSWDGSVLDLVHRRAERPPRPGDEVTVLVLGESPGDIECLLRGVVRSLMETARSWEVEVAITQGPSGRSREALLRWLLRSGQQLAQRMTQAVLGVLRSEVGTHEVRVRRFGAEQVQLVGADLPLPALPIGGIARLELDGVEVALRVGRQRHRSSGVEVWLEPVDPTARAALAVQAAAWAVAVQATQSESVNRPLEEGPASV